MISDRLYSFFHGIVFGAMVYHLAQGHFLAIGPAALSLGLFLYHGAKDGKANPDQT